jgi:hypothetical protein
MVSFRDDDNAVQQLPKLDTRTVSLGIGQGLMIDMDETDDEAGMMMMEMEMEMPSSATTESSDMTRRSEWTDFSEEAEGIEMLF